jgi:2,5-diamino-6-(ribosylamino)-4(3H)-pyrimidinone 5'-phosphate reductase
MAASAQRPRVVVHTAISVDGRTVGFPADAAAYYDMGARFGEDATLTGADTLLTALPQLAGAPSSLDAVSPLGDTARSGGDPSRPLLVVTDARGRIRDWGALRAVPYWRDLVVLLSAATPAERVSWLERSGIAFIRTGTGRTTGAGQTVDLRAALAQLAARFRVRTLRVDSGGSVSGALLAAGLVDELSVLVHPFVAAAASDRRLFVPPAAAAWEAPVRLRLVSSQQAGDGLLWLRYEVVG